MANRSNWMADTHPKAFEAFIELQRKMTPGDKFAMVIELSTMLMKLSEDSVRKMYPQASEREVFLRAAARRLGRDTVVRVYGWDPESGEVP